MMFNKAVNFVLAIFTYVFLMFTGYFKQPKKLPKIEKKLKKIDSDIKVLTSTLSEVKTLSLPISSSLESIFNNGIDLAAESLPAPPQKEVLDEARLHQCMQLAMDSLIKSVKKINPETVYLFINEYDIKVPRYLMTDFHTHFEKMCKSFNIESEILEGSKSICIDLKSFLKALEQIKKNKQNVTGADNAKYFQQGIYR